MSIVDDYAWHIDDRCDVVCIDGADAAIFLQGQLSCDVTSIDTRAWTLLLEPNGKVVAWGRLWKRSDDQFAFEVESGWGERAAARLQKFLIRTAAQISIESWCRRQYRDLGGAIGVVDAVVDALVDAGDEAWLVAEEPVPGGAIDVISPVSFETEPLGTRVADAATAELSRIAAGIPRLGAEVTEEVIPAAAGIVQRSASFTKGCYTGQEQVARIDSRGSNTPERLRLLSSVDVAAPPKPGDRLTIDGDEIGRVTSAAPTLDGRWIALGFVHRGVEVPTTVSCGAGLADVDQRSQSVFKG